MLQGLSRAEALEVDLLPDTGVCAGVEDSGVCSAVEDTVRVRLSKGPSVLCCLNAGGEVTVRNISESIRSSHTLQHSCTE